MEPDYLQDKEYEALKRRSLYLILGGLCLLFIIFFALTNAQHFLGPDISQAPWHCCEMGNKPISISEILKWRRGESV